MNKLLNTDILVRELISYLCHMCMNFSFLRCQILQFSLKGSVSSVNLIGLGSSIAIRLTTIQI